MTIEERLVACKIRAKFLDWAPHVIENYVQYVCKSKSDPGRTRKQRLELFEYRLGPEFMSHSGHIMRRRGG